MIDLTPDPADTLADSLAAWLDGDVLAAARLKRVLSEQGLHRVRPLLKEARARLRWRAVPHRVVPELELTGTPAALQSWCLLACFAHPRGQLRQAAAQALPGRPGPEAALAAMLAADDHVSQVRTWGIHAVGRLPAQALARRADFLGETVAMRDRAAWRAEATARLLADPAAHQVLSDAVLHGEPRAAVQALDFLEGAGALDEATALAFLDARAWQVRQHLADRAIRHAWMPLATRLAEDPLQLVRKALVDRAAARPGPLRDAVMRALFDDPSARIRRVASWYLSDDEALRNTVERWLGERTGSRLRLALVSAAVVLPDRAAEVASELLQSPSSADRRAAVMALMDTTGLGRGHREALRAEKHPGVRRAARLALEKVLDHQGVLELEASWSVSDGLPATSRLTLHHVPDLLRAILRDDPRALRRAEQARRLLEGLHAEGWRRAPELVSELERVLESDATGLERRAPDLARAARALVR